MSTLCYDCGKPCTPGVFTYPGFSTPDVKHDFCSQACQNNYEANGYMEAEEFDNAYGPVDSDPYDVDPPQW